MYIAQNMEPDNLGKLSLICQGVKKGGRLWFGTSKGKKAIHMEIKSKCLVNKTFSGLYAT